MGKIKDSTCYIIIIMTINYLLLGPINMFITPISKITGITLSIGIILLTIFEILIINVIINLNNNIIMIEKILEKQYAEKEKTDEKPVNIIQ